MEITLHKEGMVFDKIPMRFPRAHFYRTLRLNDHPDLMQEFDSLLDEAVALAQPKAVYRPILIQSKGPGYIMVEGNKLSSAILSSLLVTSNQLYLAASTCGIELEDWAAQIIDPLKQYWVHKILGFALDGAMRYLRQTVKSQYQTSHLSVIEPGANSNWPIEGQKLLFQLLGDLPDQIGLSLLPSYIMKPTKSVSGIMFQTSQPINRCRLCDSSTCTDRTRPFDPVLFL